MDSSKKALELYRKSQREFENHELWRRLGVTPQEFFLKLDQYVKRQGIDERLWRQKLAEIKKVVETRVQESQGEYEAVDFKQFRGLKV